MHSEIVSALVEEYRARYSLDLIEISDLPTRSEIWKVGGLQEGPGCYALYDANKLLRYVGASDAIKSRSNSHFAEKTQLSKFWAARNAKFAQLIRTREVWEPWSLEIFLTKRTDSLRKEIAP